VCQICCATGKNQALTTDFSSVSRKKFRFPVLSYSNLAQPPYITGMNDRPFSRVISMLQDVGLRPTRQRLALARLLFEQGPRHITAEALHEEARDANIRVSLATVYNTLHQFTGAGLLREVIVRPGCAYFDTNISAHHHFFYEDTGDIRDIPENDVTISRLPTLPEGTELSRVDVVVRVTGDRTGK
jgi:Fur family iron response transcriptional regulator